MSVGQGGTDPRDASAGTSVETDTNGTIQFVG
jgi:hypothetical protein